MKTVFRTFLLLILPMMILAQEPGIPFAPRHYLCYRAGEQLTIDGLMNEPAWQKAEWTEYFGDIEGVLKPNPRLKTRVKMLWDDKYLYLAAYLEEPHVWATLTERESVIFYDPDFEVFIDPDGDTHNYTEYEMNALNTQWDLLLLKPYRDDLIHNVAIDNWSYNGIKSGVHVDGTMNDPSDTDKGWSIEIAFPLDALVELSATGKNPVQGEQYRIDFSRVEWTVDIKDGKYVKRTHLVNGVEKPLPEDNWVWSPQGVIAMHQPETWGYLQFSEKEVGTTKDVYVVDPDQEVKWGLRKIYYRQSAFNVKKGKFSDKLEDLGLKTITVGDADVRPEIVLTPSGYEAALPSVKAGLTWHIRQDGLLWSTKSAGK
ncbi:MAG: carbohydrate-binding family 9-like protein [Bacteroidales bacterium]|nr:carbohydrate-binding family 9-like protein [Bacteroidales bacterium]